MSASESRRRYCPVCDRFADAFLEFGRKRRPDARCPHCGSLERHRLVWRYFQRRTDLLDGPGGTVLHIAPEACFTARLSRVLGDGYITADLGRLPAMVRMDACAAPYPRHAFDALYCSDVLEHIVDDRRAMGEFHRVLKHNGWAVLMVPVTVARTVEDPSVTDPAERRRRFGQEDHVRRYGPDFVDRLRQTGFEVDCVHPHEFLDENETTLISAGSRTVFHCTPSPGTPSAT